ncbi:hypothetical protein R4255_17470 [Rhodococcus oxybenzonivorans]|nr:MULTISPECIES: hypothetical protein [Rhodococcus]MDV7244479.1 hypothetical protein [Rhodococcus oxybenzonivorans]MDV7274278.1 hypothetical protein [Rhodococcus oxybenzonivorans]MDV7337836.1 hypothetical protein [Rhodococcus oxybenzonivorans]MDV7345228.1 hypothetical protein [Rhodococcus oxybenzonivorans]MDV8028916.1 hypothetical protein [Rhodococcus sp. IEGM 27]
MRTINKADWTPTPLVSPKGHLYTPSSYVEHRQLVAAGYAPAPEPEHVPVPAEPEPAPTPTAPVPEPAAESSEKPTDDAPAEAPKTKITRRTTGGAQ